MVRRPELWLYLLGAVTFLIIALRRVLRRLKPLNDELYSKQVAIHHVHSLVTWIRADGTIGSVNPAVVQALRTPEKELIGRAWQSLFAEPERARVEDAYRQALLMGKASLETLAGSPETGIAHVSLLLVTIHDHKSRLIGHYCLMQDRTRELELEEQIRRLSATPAAVGE